MIVWQASDGTIRVTIPADPNADIESVAAHALQADTTLAECVRLPNTDVLPSRRFRNCWRASEEKAVTVDLPLAKEQVLNEVRTERNKILDATDKEAARLADIGTKDEQDLLKEYRQQLRDFPAIVQNELDIITDVKTLEEYKASIPKRE